jgi:hypothetical protein
MKRKPAGPHRGPSSHRPPDPGPVPGQVIDQKLLDEAKRSIMPDQAKRTAKCTVCGGLCAPTSTEGLCWVCRRLKISAWRDSEQPTAQE